eukprot:TRINITY_DN2906_c0_g2_i1.p1 TRINITY_DN2906_c0_g2~~TRINITY_DN2906_c0_g2_i1.p1  ORF type:complete len:277 (+),score=29.32 TRINITY_DN2906_c0_g2_i1:70-900(+)
MANVPSKKHFSDIQHLPSYNNRLPILADLLTTLCAKNDKSGGNTKESVFSTSKPALVSVKDYLVRMCKYGHCSPTVFICMAVYVDRLCDKTGIELNSSNIHRILVGAFLISAKLNDDVYYSNKYYASIGGVSLKETNEIEAAFLEQTDWDMYVSESEYKMYMSDLKLVPPQRVQGVEDAGQQISGNEGQNSAGATHVAGTPVNALRYRRGSAKPSLLPPSKPVIKPASRRPSALSNIPDEPRRPSTDSAASSEEPPTPSISRRTPRGFPAKSCTKS